jgi:hypothetical protein
MRPRAISNAFFEDPTIGALLKRPKKSGTQFFQVLASSIEKPSIR